MSIIKKDDNNNGIIKNKSEISIDFAMIIGKYLNSNKDFINIMKVNKKYQELVEMYKFNPISDTNLFPNIETQHFYNIEDTNDVKNNMFQYITWYNIDYEDFKYRDENEIFKNVELNSKIIGWKRKYPLKIENGNCIIPEGITKIGEECFLNCEKLTNIILPYSLKELNNKSFSYSNITTIKIPEGIIKIPKKCFYNCYELTNISLPSSLIEIDEEAFSGSDLKEIIIPKNVIKIKKYSFFECYNLINVKLPSSLKEIEEYSFSKTNIKSIIIPENITRLSEGCFRSCLQLTNIQLPSSLKEIGFGVFDLDPIKIINNIIIGRQSFNFGNYSLENSENSDDDYDISELD